MRYKNLIGSLLLALCLLGVTAYRAAAASLVQEVAEIAGVDALPAEPPAAAECAAVTIIPESECNALLDLYRVTAGDQWDDNNHWRDTSNGVTPCDWYGIVCESGHVTQINLASNRLKGQLSRYLVYLPQLQQLDIADNLLTTPVSRSLCLLAERGVTGRFGYNLFDIQNRRIRQCFDQMDSTWRTTQTIPPINARIETISNTQISLSWQPISYQADGGYYEISYTSVLTQPYTVHGKTSDQSVTTYTLDNLTPGQNYYIRIRTVTPAHSQQENELVSGWVPLTAVTHSEEKVLLMVYAPFDNDLSPYAPGVLERIKAGTKLNPNIIVYFLVDRLGDHNTSLFVIANDVVTRTNAIQQVWGTDELDTMDPNVLSWFLREGRKRGKQFNVSREIVSIMGHGAGLSPEYSWLVADAPNEPPTPQNGIPPLPRDHPATPGDENDLSGFLSPIDYGRALNAATNNGSDPFDVIFFDHCFAGNLDTLYEVRNTAEVYVVSPNYAWLTASYRAYIAQFAPVATPEQLARRIISAYETALNDAHPNVIFWISNDEIKTIAEQVSDLGKALAVAIDKGNEGLILDASLSSKFIDTNQCGAANLVLAPPDEMVGISSLANQLQQRFADGTPVHTVAVKLMQSLSTIESRVRTGSPYIAPDTQWEYNNTVTILAPLQRDIARNVAWRASVYTETTPLVALWSTVPTQTVAISESLKFVQDGAWDEFINKWYTTPPAPTVGEWCNYMPPTVITDTVEETLSLVVTATESLSLTAASSELELSWSASEEDKVTGYQLLVRNNNYPNWTLLETFTLEATAFAVDLPDATNDTEFQILGQDEEGTTLSASNIAIWQAQQAPPMEMIFLPLIQR